MGGVFSSQILGAKPPPPTQKPGQPGARLVFFIPQEGMTHQSTTGGQLPPDTADAAGSRLLAKRGAPLGEEMRLAAVLRAEIALLRAEDHRLGQQRERFRQQGHPLLRAQQAQLHP